jgi:hypothetical protein
MDRMTRRLCALAVAALLWQAAAALGGPLSSYDYNATPNPVTGDILSDNTHSKIHLSNEPSVPASGSTDILLANLTTVSSASVANPDKFTNQPWTIGVTIFDEDAGVSGSVQFKGMFSGSVWNKGAKITNSFTGLTTQFLKLGGNYYTITVDSYTKPGGPNATQKGAIGASIILSDARPDGFQSPEPSTLVLGGIAAFGGFFGWRRRRLLGAAT